MTADVGLYSISVRGLEPDQLLEWAAAHRIPFLHLRGGQHGFQLCRRTGAELQRWRRVADRTIPVTGVTADIDLVDLLAAVPAAVEETLLLADAARTLGASWLRLRACHPHALHEGSDQTMPDIGLPVLAELHDPDWLLPGPAACLSALLDRTSHLQLLADTAQLAGGVDRFGSAALPVVARFLDRSAVLHLSDDGTGLDTPGQSAIAAIAAGRRLETAVEWTGADRTPAAASERHRRAIAWLASHQRARGGAL